MKPKPIPHCVVSVSALIFITACSQAKEPTENKNNPIISNEASINLDDYIPEKPKLLQPSLISNPHEGTIRNKPKPSFPPRAEKSGHCRFILNVNELGKVVTVEKLNCSDDVFTKHTKQKLLKWKFHPKHDEAGNNIPFKFGPQTITYRLTDLNGNIIPE